MIAFSGVLQLVAHAGEEVRFRLACPDGLITSRGELGSALPHKLLQTIVELLQAGRSRRKSRASSPRRSSLQPFAPASPAPGAARAARHRSRRGVSLGDEEPCGCPCPSREVLDLDIGGLAEMSDAAADQTLRKGGKRASGLIGEAQTSGPDVSHSKDGNSASGYSLRTSTWI